MKIILSILTLLVMALLVPNVQSIINLYEAPWARTEYRIADHKEEVTDYLSNKYSIKSYDADGNLLSQCRTPAGGSLYVLSINEVPPAYLNDLRGHYESSLLYYMPQPGKQRVDGQCPDDTRVSRPNTELANPHDYVINR